MGKSRFALSRTASPDEVAEYLMSLVHGLKRGELSFKSGGSALRFVPGAKIAVEVRVTRQGKKGKIELRLDWKTLRLADVTALRVSIAPGVVGADVSRPTRTGPSVSARRAARTGAILVIEEEEYLRSMLRDTLAAAGYAVESAANGRDGLARFHKGDFDVVLSAVSMPRGAGLDMVRAVKKTSPTTPIVMIAGWGDLMSPEQMGEAGIDFVLVKPFKTERVLAVLADALALRHSRCEG